jgi:hypothetical protein
MKVDSETYKSWVVEMNTNAHNRVVFVFHLSTLTCFFIYFAFFLIRHENRIINTMHKKSKIRKQTRL